MGLPSEPGPGCAPPAVCKALLPSDRVRRATEVDRGDRIEKEKALARPFPKHNEALRSFFLSLQDSVLVGIGEEGNVIRRRYLVSLTASGHDSKWDKRRPGGDLADFHLFRMHVDKQYRNDFSACQFRLAATTRLVWLSHANQNGAAPDVGNRDLFVGERPTGSGETPGVH
jgi:hypothetical protein